MADDGQVVVRFQDTLTNTCPDLLGIDRIEVTGILYNRAPVITVAFPNGGEYLSVGSRPSPGTAWTSNGDVVTYNIYLSPDSGARTRSESLYGRGVCRDRNPATRSWDGFNTAAFADCNQCLIQITASDDETNTYDFSDAVFVIDNTPPTVTLTALNGGQLLRGGAVFTITWTASDAHFGPTPIALAYSLDGGSTYTDIVTATANDGEYAWTVPEVETTTVRVRVTATDLVGHSASSKRRGDFTIDSTPPAGTLSIAEGGYVRVREVHLLLTASDDVVQMYLNGDLEDAPDVRQWVTFTSSLTVTLTDNEGNKTVRVHALRTRQETYSDWRKRRLSTTPRQPVIADLSPADGSVVTTATPVHQRYRSG